MAIKTQERFEKDLELVNPGFWIVVGEYKGSHSKVKVKCAKCFSEFYKSATSLLSGVGCNNCNKYKKNKRKYTTESVGAKIDEVTGGEFELNGEYVDSNTKIEVKHKTCGYIWEVYYGNLVNKGSRCPKCSGKYNMTAEEFNIYVEEVSEGEYTCLTPFYKNTQHVIMKHNHCGHTYAVTPKNFKKGRRCPQCGESYGETKIRHTLERLGVKYEQEKYLHTGMISPNHFRLDFFLPEYKNVIEYDGRQHFYPTEPFGGEPVWERTKIYDSLKYEMVLNKGWGIKLISFRDFDRLEEVIEKHVESLRNPNPLIRLGGKSNGAN